MARQRWLLCLTAAAVAALGPAPLGAQPAPARIKLDPDRRIGEVNPHVFSNFAEHLGRCIYGGMFDGKSPLADADGFRPGILDAAGGLGLILLRWPRGNFASGYNFDDGIWPPY